LEEWGVLTSLPLAIGGIMPTKRYCVTVVEIDGVELDYQEELALDGDVVYFTDSTFTSDNVQDAIIESIGRSGAARTPFGFYYDANASSGRWLEVNKGVPSNTSPHVMAEDGKLASATISVKNNTTCTAEVFLNGVSIITLTLLNSQTAAINNINITVSQLDELSVQITSGSCTEPNVQIKQQVTA